jgi:hypothetical protein
VQVLSAEMLNSSFARLNTIAKELAKQSKNLVEILEPEFEVVVDIFKYIFASIDIVDVPFYFTEYCVKVATVLDVVEALEFGRLRSMHLTTAHERFISVDKTGGFMITPRPSEKDLRLTTCSHEGLNYLFKIFEVCDSFVLFLHDITDKILFSEHSG